MILVTVRRCQIDAITQRIGADYCETVLIETCPDDQREWYDISQPCPPPERLSRFHARGDFQSVLMRCNVCGREKIRTCVGNCRMCGGWMRPIA